MKGYAQVAGLDYADTFSPIARHDTIRLMGYLDSDWAESVDDVKSTFGYAFTLRPCMF